MASGEGRLRERTRVHEGERNEWMGINTRDRDDWVTVARLGRERTKE